MTYTITIEAPPASANVFYAGKHWAKRKQIADYWHALVKAAVNDGPPIPEFIYPVTIMFIVTQDRSHKGRKVDTDNVLTKLITDGLVLAGVIRDDGINDYNYMAVANRLGDSDCIVVQVRWESEAIP
jgi:Holliday junction resolvase RusA-like endonuclease